MAFTFAAFTYIAALIVDAFLLFFSIFHVSIFVCMFCLSPVTMGTCSTDVKVTNLCFTLDNCFRRAEDWLQEPDRPVRLAQPSCAARASSRCLIIATSLNSATSFSLTFSHPSSLRYILHILFNFLFLIAGEWFSILLNAPLIGYHIHRYDSPYSDNWLPRPEVFFPTTRW